MSVLRLRLALCGVLASVLVAAGHVASAQVRRRARDVRGVGRILRPVTADAGGPGSRRRHTAERVALLRACERETSPPGRAAARVKAGSVLEDDDQQGLAHFVEHMEFEGTRHFPSQSMVEFLSSLGQGIGPDVNARTSYDDTQYTLRVPTDVPGVLDRALLVLEDWAQGASFDQSGIDRQRGIVLSEWRMRLGAGERTQDKIRRVQLEGSRYANRSPSAIPPPSSTRSVST